MFVVLILVELLQWWNHIPVFKKVHELASEIKDTHLCHTQMCACQRNFAYFSENCAGFHDKIINSIKSGSLHTCLFQRTRREFDTRNLIPHVCTLAIEKKMF